MKNLSEMQELQLKKIAVIYNGYEEKFGIPRQSGLAAMESRIVFEKAFRSLDAVRELDQYSHIWLLWGFSQVKQEGFSATVRPPRLGGNTRVGVFASRSPFRPNPIGLSSVKLLRIERDGSQAPVLVVEGADLMNGTPIYDIKPYLPYVDCHPQAVGGFSDTVKDYRLTVAFAEGTDSCFSEQERLVLKQILEQDPRPSYQEDAQRVYGMSYAGRTVRFRVEGKLLTVVEVYN